MPRINDINDIYVFNSGHDKVLLPIIKKQNTNILIEIDKLATKTSNRLSELPHKQVFHKFEPIVLCLSKSLCPYARKSIIYFE